MPLSKKSLKKKKKEKKQRLGQVNNQLILTVCLASCVTYRYCSLVSPEKIVSGS